MVSEQMDQVPAPSFAGVPPERLDFTAGTALPETGADGPSPVRHLLLGTDGLGDEGAAAVAASGGEVETLYLGCNGITAAGACRIADQLRASPQVVTGVWLKRRKTGP